MALLCLRGRRAASTDKARAGRRIDRCTRQQQILRSAITGSLDQRRSETISDALRAVLASPALAVLKLCTFSSMLS